MEQDELLRFGVEALERLGLSYLVTGSIATVLYGEPRFTNDIDLVVVLTEERIDELCRSFPPPDFYLSPESVRRAVDQESQFNIIHPASGLKLDIMVPAETSFNRSRFGRARRIRLTPDLEVSFAAPEDVIIKKMEYYREGRSEKHLRDITGVLKVSAGQVDRGYIADWADRLGLEEIWLALARRVPP
jgi:hypothetical protein